MSGQTCLRDEDAVELGEMLEFIRDWTTTYAFDDLADHMSRFTAGGYTLTELRADLNRFAFLLGGDGDEFVHDAHE
jgi:hypothetical protein